MLIQRRTRPSLALAECLVSGRDVQRHRWRVRGASVADGYTARLPRCSFVSMAGSGSDSAQSQRSPSRPLSAAARCASNKGEGLGT